MIECEYVTEYDGKELSIFYSGGYTWTAWLEGQGNIASAFNAEDAIIRVNEKLLTSFTEKDFTYIKH